MVDPAVVSRKLRQIEQYHGELREKQDLSRDQFLDDVTEAAGSRPVSTPSVSGRDFDASQSRDGGLIAAVPQYP